MLESKVENASTISIKEKYRQDMKREIKRLQRLRDMFRQNINNPAVLEQNKLVEARKRIETVSKLLGCSLSVPETNSNLCLTEKLS
mgnify:FL=1